VSKLDLSSYTEKQLLNGIAKANKQGAKESADLFQAELDRRMNPPSDPSPTTETDEGPSIQERILDYTASFGSGIPQGLEFMLNIPNYASTGIQKGIEYVTGAEPFDRSQLPDYANVLSPESIGKGMETITGGAVNYEPKTKAGEVFQAGGQGLPFGMLGGLRAALVEGILPSMASEKAAQYVEGSAAELPVRLATGLLTPSAIEGGARLLKSGALDVPAPVTPERMAQSKQLEELGIQETVGQISGDPNILAREAATQMGRTMNEKQLETFTKEVLRRAGITADRASPEVLDKGFTRLGKVFDEFAENASIPIDAKLADDFSNAIFEAENVFAVANVPRVIQDVRDNFIALQGGNRVISGKDFQSITKKLAIMRKSKDPVLMGLGAELNGILVDALEKSVMSSGNTSLLRKYQEARNQYRALDSATQAVGGQSDEAMAGLIQPKALYAVEKGKIGSRNVSKGRSELAELGRMGSDIVPLPQSGTTPRGTAEGAFGAAAVGIPTAGGVALGSGGELADVLQSTGLAATVGGATARANARRNELIGTQAGQEFLRGYLRGEGRPLMSPFPIGGILTDYTRN
jgi:hypothetical protein